MHIQGFHPAIVAPQQAQAASSNAAAAASSGSSSASNTNDPTSASGLQSTFLNLLVTELQNQDPTQPVDPTEMVSQMVSLNQLDQLISINQTLTSLTQPIATTPTTPTTSNPTQTGNSNPSTGSGSVPGTDAAAASKTPLWSRPASQEMQQMQQIPASTNPAAWMNLYGNMGALANTTNHTTAAGGR